jgi:small subunit ribosomal protein S4
MGRHTGPVERLSRRSGVDLELKGARLRAGKGALDRRGAIPPGTHGARRRKPSIYAEQLRAKQAAKWYYGMRERQFRRAVAAAARDRERPTGEALVALLERRLDNVLVRAGLAATRAQARQFISHGHVEFRGRRCTIASARVSSGDRVAIRDGSPVVPLVDAAARDTAAVPPWLQADHARREVVVLRLPERYEVRAPIEEHLIIEFYSRG